MQIFIPSEEIEPTRRNPNEYRTRIQ